MFSIASESQSLDRHANRFTVEALASALPQRWVTQAIAESGRLSKRVRQLPDVLTTWIVILLGLYRRQSYRNLLEMLFEAGHHRGLWAAVGAPTTSALVKARDRLGVEPLRLLFEESARRWAGLVSGAYFAGRRVLALDGTTLKLPDTAANRKYFGLPGVSRGRAGYPQLRMVTLRDVGSRMTRAVRFGCYRVGEMTLARKLLQCIPAASLVLMDRNFMAYDLLHDMHEQGVDFLVRVKGTVTSTVVLARGHGDAIVRVEIPRHWRKDRPDLPRTWLLREIRYRPPGGTEVIRLFTTLILDSEITRQQLIDLYPQRWQEETAFDEIKTHQLNSTTITQPTHLRSQNPERVKQELYGLLIAHNAVRFTMAQAAEASDQDPLRLSFTSALIRIQESVRDMMRSATRRLAELFSRLLAAIGRARVPERPGRSHPRAVKIKMSGYPLRRYAMA